MRCSENRRRILDALTGLDNFMEYGPPPYSAADVVLMIGGNVRNTSRALKGMEKHGLVRSEIKLRDQWCEVPKPGHYSRPTRCYWSLATIEEDQARAKAWLNGSAERSARALDTMIELFSRG
ncbi:hypothetical protein [Marinobacter nauticus]|uniref:hypothetical protein n=1 Tax=Marinobacter nauticus TaxID=2743 RepID=UPI001C99DBDB|nr:hypothetical protein [Marinobacter nauticus]MBY5963768.1 hypothetical protein [Marinobacter nauticus]